MTGFVHVGSANRLAKLTRGRSRVYHCNGQAVAVFKARDGYVAVSDSCPHMGASLSQGRLTGNRLECSWHEWKFDTDTGISDAREWCCLNVFDVRIEGDKLFLRQRPKPDRPDREKPEQQSRNNEDWIRWDPDRHFRKSKNHGDD